jgi:hypothetical protein
MYDLECCESEVDGLKKSEEVVHYFKVCTNKKCVLCEFMLILLELKAEPVYCTCSFTDFLNAMVLLSTLLGARVNFGAYVSIKHVILLLKLKLYKVITRLLYFIVRSVTVFTQHSL